MISNTTKTLIAGAVSVAMIAGGTAAFAADKEGKEKCYGVVKAGKNDCANASGSHSCAGQTKEDGAASEWVLVPKGLCDKLVGGSTESK